MLYITDIYYMNAKSWTERVGFYFFTAMYFHEHLCTMRLYNEFLGMRLYNESLGMFWHRRSMCENFTVVI